MLFIEAKIFMVLGIKWILQGGLERKDNYCL